MLKGEVWTYSKLNFMKNIIKQELENNGIQNIKEINQINGNLYFIKTENATYTYDIEEKVLEKSETNENEETIAVHSCMLTNEEKNKIAEENLKLIHYVLKGFSNINIDYEELESVGYLGFAKALNSFDKMKGIRFSTYAINCIMNEVLFFLRKEKKHFNNISLDTKLQTDNKGNVLTIEDTIEDKKFSENGIDFNLMKDEEKKILFNAIKKLNEEEQYIMLYRYGVCGYKAKTQKQLAEELNMSQANVSKIQRNCLRKLRFILQKEANR